MAHQHGLLQKQRHKQAPAEQLQISGRISSSRQVVFFDISHTQHSTRTAAVTGVQFTIHEFDQRNSAP
jgi:hypothetical protein